ncbi:TnsA endonuclease N-terminal domain-containing protein [Metallibacterium sp.]
MSDLEWAACIFAVMLPNVLDLREQFPLSIEPAAHELTAYDVGHPASLAPGTSQLAEGLGIHHPKVHGDGRSILWPMTTDLLLTLRYPSGQLELLAVACKYDSELQHRRTVEKLRLEAAYWQARSTKWLLISPSLYDPLVALTLRQSFPWALGEAVPAATRRLATDIARDSFSRSLSEVLTRLAGQLGAMEIAQRAFWQAAWSGDLPLDLRRGWRPHIPISLLFHEDFRSLNPIASRRSSWKG